MIDVTRSRPATPSSVDPSTGEDVYRIPGQWTTHEVRVPEGTELRMQDNRWAHKTSTDPRSTLPNVEVKEGVLVIPLSDMVEMVMARAEPADIARELWANDEVRDEFISCASTRYSSGGIGDEDRRKLLTALQSAVHDEALDVAVRQLQSMEHDVRQITVKNFRTDSYGMHYNRVLEWVERSCNDVAVAEFKREFGDSWPDRGPDSEDFAIGRKHWNESSTFWRKKLLEMFAPPPTQPLEE